jgi:Domain of unknown function (DUF4440)
MELTRRHLAAASALALGATALLRSSPVLAEEEAGVKEAVEALRLAALKADKAKLEALAADQVSYGHSDGRVQNKAEFVDGVVNRKAVAKSIDFPELKITMAGNNAIARHLYVSESETDGKPNSVKIGMLAGVDEAGRRLEAVGAPGLQARLIRNRQRSAGSPIMSGCASVRGCRADHPARRRPRYAVAPSVCSACTVPEILPPRSISSSP